MITKYTIEDYDKAVEDHTIAKVLGMMIEKYIHGKYKDLFTPFSDKIRIAFSGRNDINRSNSDIVISFADFQGTTVLLFGQNDPEYRISKTKYRYVDPVVPFVLFTKHKDNEKYVNRPVVYKHISTLVEAIIDKSGIKPDVINIYLDMYFDEAIKFTDVLEEADYDEYDRILNYAIDEIEYKFKNRIPIEYKFANQLRINGGDPDYEAIFDMNMYIYGVYNHNGEYSILAMYNQRTSKSDFEPEYVSTAIDISDLNDYIRSYIDTFNHALERMFIPKSDDFFQNVLERVY